MSQWIREDDLAKRLGVAREVLAEVRTRVLTKDDWALQKNAVTLSPAAVEKISAALDAPQEATAAEPSPEEQNAPCAVYVRRRALKNIRVLFATEKKDAPPESERCVRVRDNRCFTPGQEIQVQRGEGGVWHLHGRQPRTRGNIRLASRKE